MRLESMASADCGKEAKEQKTEKGNRDSGGRVQVREEWKRFYGELKENDLPKAGKMFKTLFIDEGRAVAREFYRRLHSETKFYLQREEKFRTYVKAMQMGGF